MFRGWGQSKDEADKAAAEVSKMWKEISERKRDERLMRQATILEYLNRKGLYAGTYEGHTEFSDSLKWMEECLGGAVAALIEEVTELRKKLDDQDDAAAGE